MTNDVTTDNEPEESCKLEASSDRYRFGDFIFLGSRIGV